MSSARHSQLGAAAILCTIGTLSLGACSDKRTTPSSGDAKLSEHRPEAAIDSELVGEFFGFVESGKNDEAVSALKSIGENLHWAEDVSLPDIRFTLTSPPTGTPNEQTFDYISISNEMPYRLSSNEWSAFVSALTSNGDPEQSIRFLLTVDLLLKQVMLSHAAVDPERKGSWPITAASLYRAGIRQKLASIAPNDPRGSEWEAEKSALIEIAQRKVVNDESIVP